ncbi:hypothetical protein IFM89_031642, partial [Coptis chinensis]
KSDGMKKSMEGLLYGARVDVVFAGHVHAYERFLAQSAKIFWHAFTVTKLTVRGPVHITIGDGETVKALLASKYIDPKPETSLFREASFEHGRFKVVNTSHALWEWHRNDDVQSIVADTVWLRSHVSDPACKV